MSTPSPHPGGGSEGPAAFGTPLLIANPSAGRARDDRLTRLVQALAERGVRADVEVTSRRGHAVELARDAALAGRRLVVAVGGDGTVNEVVNGLVDVTTGKVRGDDPVLAVVAAGSGSDLARTFGLDRTPETLARHLVTDDVIRIDLGRVRARGRHGGEQVRLFANVAQAGYGASVARLAGQLPRRMSRVRYAVATALAVPKFRRVPIALTVEGTTTTAPLCNVVVANAQFFGGGMRVAPRALPTDGLLDVQSWGCKPLDVIVAQPQLRRGTHLERDDVQERRATRVQIDAARPVAVEVDGEALGTTPASVEVLPGALRFKL